ncbi:MAG: sugar phosphate nucleotidyltransferase [Nitrospirae bacterium]|nr:sugar phosphate nucleotidyltransferase [Nitrospirota bacterium]MCL5976709.1 sugar phosphate nucleotidyltransferase [Nitrospirota bacterium]
MSFKKIDPNLKVLILCGGKGERLKPLTHKVPKPLIQIKGKPMLNYLISYFETYGLKKFVVAVGYKSEEIAGYFKKNHSNLDIRIVDSGDADIQKRIQDAIQHIPGDFIMCYGDTLANVDLHGLIAFHKRHKRKVSITLYPLQSQFGILDLDGSGKVVSFEEKPTLDKWINIGYFYFSGKSRDDIAQSRSFVNFLQRTVKKNEMFGFKHTGLHITVNTITELQEAEKSITKFDEILRR